ncbi:MAG TPA: ABC transporter substrate-binding protein [Acidimicrobiales bacterium]|nr:ABC transporter substrate-binding protein [Acidimicrobiales bacterium]
MTRPGERRTIARRGAQAVALVGALVLSACGTRLPDEAFAPTTQVIGSDGAAVDEGSGFAPGDGEGATDPAAGRSGAGDAAAGTRGQPGAPSSAPAGGGAVGGGAGGAAGGAGAGGGGGGEANQASDVGITETTIRLGNITAENGVLGDTFAPAVRGLRAWVQATNAAGGVAGRKVELFTCDDREDRSRSLECARRLVEGDQVFALVATNSRSLGGAAQYLADQGVPVLGFPISNSFYRYPNFFTVYGTGYARDGKSVGVDGNIVTMTGQYRWFKEHLGVSKAAVFNYDISESSQAGDQFVAGLEAEGYDVTQYTVSFAAPSFDQAVADMQQRKTDIIFDAMDDGANRRLCDSMARRGFQPKAKVSTVVVMGDSLGENYNDTCRDIVHVPVEARPYSSDHPPIAAFRDAYARYQPGLPLHQWALEAWVMGEVTAQAIESMAAAPTRKGFIDHLNTMPANDVGGIVVGMDFRPEAYDYRSPTSKDCLGIARWQGDGWTLASEFPLCYPDAKNVSTAAREQGN